MSLVDDLRREGLAGDVMGILDRIIWALERPQQGLFQGARRGSDRASVVGSELMQRGVPAPLAVPMANVASVPEFLRGIGAGLTGSGTNISGEDLSGNSILGTILDFTADPAAVAGTPFTKAGSRALKLAAKRRAIARAVPEYGEVLQKLPTLREGIRGVGERLVQRARRAVPSFEGMSPVPAAAELGKEGVGYRAILKNALGRHSIDIPYVPKSISEPLILRSPTASVEPITDALNLGKTRATGKFVPLSERTALRILGPRAQGRGFMGDLILSGNKGGARTLRHEGGHWAEDLLNEGLSGLGSRPFEQTAEAYSKTGLAPNVVDEVISQVWKRNSPGVQGFYRRNWPGLSERRLASEFVADLADPRLGGFEYRTHGKFPLEQLQGYVGQMESAEPRLRTLREFADTKYNPAWEQVTRGNPWITPAAAPANLSRPGERR